MSKIEQIDIQISPEKNIEKMTQEFMNLEVVQVGRGIYQNKFHEFDVYEHAEKFAEHINDILKDNPDPELSVAGVLHDIGKPVVAKVKEKDGVVQEREPGKPYHEFDDHEIVGEDMVMNMKPELFKKYKLDQKRIAKLVGAHYIPMKGIKSMRKATNFEDFKLAYEELKNLLSQTGLPEEDVMTMFLADKLAQGKFCTDKDELFAIRNFILDEQGGDLRNIYEIQKKEYGGKE